MINGKTPTQLVELSNWSASPEQFWEIKATGNIFWGPPGVEDDVKVGSFFFAHP